MALTFFKEKAYESDFGARYLGVAMMREQWVNRCESQRKTMARNKLLARKVLSARVNSETKIGVKSWIIYRLPKVRMNDHQRSSLSKIMDDLAKACLIYVATAPMLYVITPWKAIAAAAVAALTLLAASLRLQRGRK